jgi:hypothetical protein
MYLKKNVFLLMITCLLSTATACQEEDTDDNTGDPEGSEKESSDFSTYTGRGSRDCQEWQFSICEYVYVTCDFGTASREKCEEQYGSMSCKSDETALACAKTFQEGNCASPPTSCDFDTIADPEPAIQGCNAVLTAECDRWLSCGLADSMDDCMEELASSQSCEDAIGLAPWYEDCLEKMQNRGCADLPPEGCDGLIIGG